MAEGQTGLRKEDLRDWAPWTILFSSFKIALDPKKLLLAGAGILTMAFGWWLLATAFYALAGGVPEWEEVKKSYSEQIEKDKKAGTEAAWKDFKSRLAGWNLMHKLAGPVDLDEAVPFTAADFVNSPVEYEKVLAKKKEIEGKIAKRLNKVKIAERGSTKQQSFAVNGFSIDFDRGPKVDAELVDEKLDGKISARHLHAAYKEDTDEVHINGLTLAVKDLKEWKKFSDDFNATQQLTEIEKNVNDDTELTPEQKKIAQAAIRVLRLEDVDRYKPAGYLTTWPWFEDRGPNPFLLVAGLNPDQVEKDRRWPWAEGRFPEWLFTIQIPVLIEPLVKFFSPVIYLLHPAAGILTKIYLILVILWTLATWAFFGGAITRMAAVQVARPTESISMSEAIRFTCQRYLSYLSAQLIPLGFLAFLAVLLIIFGFLFLVTYFVGDIVVAGIGLPIALIFGVVMAMALVGLVGWPMMYGTISTEGSDSFDAISRSYSYVYQAPWSYLWYCFIAVLYGAALVFFIGLMGSLTIYLTKWGMSQVPNWWDREPSYLFMWAPTSYGWRDLLLAQSPHVSTEFVMRTSGAVESTYVLEPSFQNSLGIHNYIGGFLVAFWVWLMFLFVLGFGYSYFWTAGTIIYLLMRRKVDDNEMDEVYLEEDEFDAPYMPPSPAKENAATKPSNGGAQSLQMVDSPAVRSPSAPPEKPKPDESPPPDEDNKPEADESPPESDEEKASGDDNASAQKDNDEEKEETEKKDN